MSFRVFVYEVEGGTGFEVNVYPDGQAGFFHCVVPNQWHAQQMVAVLRAAGSVTLGAHSLRMLGEEVAA